MGRLEGKVAVVTGAASGIGRALVDELTLRGLSVMAADVEAEALEQAAQEASRASGRRVLPVSVDVRDAAQVEALAARTLETFGRVDVICNNAGVVTSRLPIWEQSAEDWQWVVEVNLLGVANGVRSFVPHLVAANSGHVVNTASIAGLSTLPGGGNGGYSATKHAVVGLSETLRLELDAVAPGVGVTVLCPGPVTSRIHDAGRNRPAELQSPQRPGTGQPPVSFAHGMETISAREVAEGVSRAVEGNLLYLLPGPGTAAHARSRLDRLLADLPPS